MAQVLVHGVAQATLKGTHGQQPWAVVTHWKYDNLTQDWTPTAIQQLADLLSTNWNTFGAPHCGNTVTLTSVDTVDIGSAAPAVGTNTTSHVGTGAGGALANSAMATLIGCKIAARYRGGHPRMYLPWGTNTDVLNESNWNATYINSSAQAWVNIVSAIRTGIPPISANSVSQVSVHYVYDYVDDPIHHKYRHIRTDLKAVHIIAQYITNPVFGSQRRRLHV